MAKVEDAVKVGDEVQVKVLSVDPEKKRISLSIRQAIEPEPVAEEATAETAAADEYEVVATEDSVSEKFAQAAEETAEAVAEEATAEAVAETVEEAAEETAAAAEAVEEAVKEAAEEIKE